MTTPIDFQSDENRWAAEMACEEVNALGNIVNDVWKPEMVIPPSRCIYALALRILRTETKPVDKDLLRAREICADQFRGDGGEAYLRGDHDKNYIIRCVIAALKEGRGE